MKKFCFLFLPLLMILASCSSLQDVIVSVDLTEQAEDIQNIEEKLSVFDAAFFINPESLDDKELEDFEKEIDEVLGVSGLQSASEARLQALKGRVLLLSGKKNKAKECYDKSVNAYKGDIQSMILARRLDFEVDFSSVTEEEKPLVTLEYALKSFSENVYLDSVAKFDEAFLDLKPYYKDSYMEVRNKAWLFRSIDATQAKTEIVKLLMQEKLTVGQFFMLAQQTTQLLHKYTGDKKFGEKELFKTVSANKLLEPVSATVTEKDVNQNDIVNRILCARILWNLYNDFKDSVNLCDKYSKVYRNSDLESPVADIALDNSDFDAVLGCVENEVMDLVDGICFEPESTVSAVEADEYLKKIKK